jgi:excisionase family DNA binding protein
VTIEETIRAVIREELATLARPAAGEWLTPDDVAEQLRLEVSTVYQKIRRGVIPAHRFDGRIYVSRAELDEAIRSAPRPERAA